MPKPSALGYALKLLGYRARTERELRERLIGKGYLAETVDETLYKLVDVKLIDDGEFAVSYVRNKLSINRRGPRRIYFELLKRGVARKIAEGATKTIAKEAELVAAQSLLAARVRQWAKLDPLTKKRRAIGLLYRRGFSPDISVRLLKEL